MRPLIVSFALMLLSVAPVAARAENVCTLVVDAASGAPLREEGDCRSRVTSASTFKVALAVMGYDAGILTAVDTPVMAFRPGDPYRGGPDWKRDTGPADWMRHSVVWYSQRITRAMGGEALARHAAAFGYGNGDFSRDPGFDNGLERAWIASSLRIFPREQAAFLRALVLDAVPVGAQAMQLARDIIEIRPAGGWELHGKTGTAYPRLADRRFDHARGWGWYVGWAQKDDSRLVFVRLTRADRRQSGSPGKLTRDAFLLEWPEIAADIAR